MDIMVQFNSTFLLRLPLAIILLMHSIPGMFNNGIHDFGHLFLNAIGFAPFGVAIAWAVKLSHVVSAVLLLINKYVRWASWVNIFIFLFGIILVHAKDGWFVVGGGRNGIEFNALLIFVSLALIYPYGFPPQPKQKS